ncbi:MAG TPA: hypothetical protein DDW20_04385 [Firmicutes bacterium]|nr:hypothetical protein [Bacillota bacterium]
MEAGQINKIGIVYAGCGVKAAAELSFAKQIIDKVGYERISVVSGSSLSSLNAYATGCKCINNVLNVYNTFGFNNILTFNNKHRKELTKNIFDCFDGSNLEIKTYVSATNLKSFKANYFCMNNAFESHKKALIKLSTGFPMYIGLQSFDNSIYLSGTVSDNYPLLPLIDEDLDMVIILHANPKYYPPLDFYKKIKKGTVVVDVDVSLHLSNKIRIFSVSKNAISEMIHVGETDGWNFANYIFLDFAKNNVRERVYEYVSSNLEDRNKKDIDGSSVILNVFNVLYDMKEDNL